MEPRRHNCSNFHLLLDMWPMTDSTMRGKPRCLLKAGVEIPDFWEHRSLQTYGHIQKDAAPVCQGFPRIQHKAHSFWPWSSFLGPALRWGWEPAETRHQTQYQTCHYGIGSLYKELISCLENADKTQVKSFNQHSTQ
jgi:hypothetical protein